MTTVTGADVHELVSHGAALAGSGRVTHVAVEALWQDLLAEVQRVSREIERDEQGEFMVKKRDTVPAQPVASPGAATATPKDVDQSSEDSFPASDPPAWAPLHVGGPRNIGVANAPASPRA